MRSLVFQLFIFEFFAYSEYESSISCTAAKIPSHPMSFLYTGLLSLLYRSVLVLGGPQLLALNAEEMDF